ncbi:MAG: glutathione S-transferase family protein [Pseudomonadota bacterium]
MHLYIGNKNYSSWSLRAWLLLRAFDLEFEETLIPLDEEDTAARIHLVSEAGKVPVLVDRGQTIWDSLAIAEYVHELFPDTGIWPADAQARAHARSSSAEMHSSFVGLRGACPMNLAKRFARKDRGADVAADVTRIQDLWIEARDRFGSSSGDPFLYGAFSAADAMYAPVVTRFETYNIEVRQESRAYMDAILNHPAFDEWRNAGLQEAWIIDQDEVDEVAIENLRTPLR